MFVFIGTYTQNRPDGGGSKGVYVTRLDQTTGKLGTFEVAAELKNPSFVAASRDGRFLYAVSEVGDPEGTVSAYAIRADGTLSLLNTVPSRGADPCHITVARSGRTVAVANYSSGTTVSIRTRADGSLGSAIVDRHAGSGPNKERQARPFAHSVDFTADDRFLLSSDLGADRIYLYRHDPRTSAIAPHEPPFVALEPGAGPRHLALHPSGRYAYVITELSNTVAAFAWNGASGTLRQTQTISTLPFGHTAPSFTAEIAVHPSGRFLYGSNRGHDSIAVFGIDASSGRLSLLSHAPTGGKFPRSFAIDPSGRWLIAANQQSDQLVTFAIDRTTGALTRTGAPATVPRAVCVQFVPAARRASRPAG